MKQAIVMLLMKRVTMKRRVKQASTDAETKLGYIPRTSPIQNIQMVARQFKANLGYSGFNLLEAPINLEEKTDLDEISSLEDNEDNEENEQEEEDTEKLQEDAHVVEETPNYAKMTVASLKKIASKKGITGYNKLRKQGLVDILSN